MPRTIPMLAMLAAGLSLAAIATRVHYANKAGSPAVAGGEPDPEPPLPEKPARAQPEQVSEPVRPAQTEKKWLILRTHSAAFSGGDWMEGTTWKDQRVITWLDEHAAVTSVDTDTDTQTVQTLSLQGPPMTVAYKDDKEFDRVVGSMAPNEFLDWLDGLERGERSIELYVGRPTSADVACEQDALSARLETARQLTRSGLRTQAADEYIQIWNSLRSWEPTMTSVRAAPVVEEVKQLINQSSAARTKFVALRDSTGERLEGEKVVADDLINWIALNRVLDDNAATVDWYDRTRKDRRKRPLVYRVHFMIEELLIARGRWADLARTIPDPMIMLEQLRRLEHDLDTHSAPEGMEAAAKFAKEFFQQSVPHDVGRTYAGLLAAGQEAEAAAFANKARECFGAARMNRAMAGWALRAGEPRRAHIQWLSADPSDEAAAALRARVEQALKNKMTSVPPC